MKSRQEIQKAVIDAYIDGNGVEKLQIEVMLDIREQLDEITNWLDTARIGLAMFYYFMVAIIIYIVLTMVFWMV